MNSDDNVYRIDGPVISFSLDLLSFLDVQSELELEKVKSFAYSGRSIKYPMPFKMSDDCETLKHLESDEEILINIDNYRQLEKYIDLLDREYKTLSETLYPFDSFLKYCNKCYDKLSDEGNIESTIEQSPFYDMIINSFTKHFIPDIYSDMNHIFSSNINPFFLVSKRRTSLKDISDARFKSMKNAFLNFFDENNLKKENYEKLFSLVGELFFSSSFLKDLDVDTFKEYEASFVEVCEDIFIDFRDNQDIIVGNIRDRVNLSNSVFENFGVLSVVYDVFENIDILRCTSNSIEDNNPGIQDLRKLRAQLSGLNSRKIELISSFDKLKEPYLKDKRGIYSKAIGRTKEQLHDAEEQLKDFYSQYKISAEDVGAVFHVLSEYALSKENSFEIKTYEDVKWLIDADFFKKQWHRSPENEKIYKQVHRLLKKKNGNENLEGDIAKIISTPYFEYKRIINAENTASDRLEALNRATEYELVEFESLLPITFGFSDVYRSFKDKLGDIEDQDSSVQSQISSQMQSLSYLGPAIQNAINIMDSEGIDVTYFSDDVTFNMAKADLIELSNFISN